MRIILRDGTEITYLSDTGVGNIIAEYDTVEDANIDIGKLTPSNLRSFQIADDEGTVIGEYADMILDSTQIFPKTREESGEEYQEVHFHLRAKTDIEKMADRLSDAEAQITELQEAIVEIVSGI